MSDEDLSRIEENACPTCGSCSGMFTANSMNCLTEALGLALPGNGTTLATHTARRALYEAAGTTVMTLTRAFYERDDAGVLPRAIAGRGAFGNAMAMDIAMGGSSNTILHLLAAAHEAELDFTLADIDRISRNTPCLSKVAPNGPYLVEDVHRAGGIPAILGELDRAGLLSPDVRSIHSPDLRSWLDDWDIRGVAANRRGRRAVPCRPRRPSVGHRFLPVRAVGEPGHRPREWLCPCGCPCVQHRGRAGRAARQSRRWTAAW